jgi:hypothetical protein
MKRSRMEDFRRVLERVSDAVRHQCRTCGKVLTATKCFAHVCDMESVNADKEAGFSEKDVLERGLSDKTGPYYFPPLEVQAGEASHLQIYAQSCLLPQDQELSLVKDKVSTVVSCHAYYSLYNGKPIVAQGCLGLSHANRQTLT